MFILTCDPHVISNPFVITIHDGGPFLLVSWAIPHMCVVPKSHHGCKCFFPFDGWGSQTNPKNLQHKMMLPIWLPRFSYCYHIICNIIICFPRAFLFYLATFLLWACLNWTITANFNNAYNWSNAFCHVHL